MTPRGLVEVILWLEDLFDRLGLDRSYGGAIAYNFYGPPRLTQDVDVLVLLPDLKIPSFVEALATEGCLHGEDEPHAPALRAVLDDLRGSGRMAVFHCFGVRVEVFVPWHPFHRAVLARSPERDLEGRRIRIHAAEDLIVFKKIFDRPKDLTDIRAILLAQKGRLDLARIRRDAAGLLADDSLAELDRLIDECI